MSNYTCNFNLDDCIKKLGLEEGGLVQAFVTNEFKKNVQAYVPKDLAKKYENPGQLVDSCHIENGTDVVWNTPYARRLYYHPEYNYQGARQGAVTGQTGICRTVVSRRLRTE